jgi:hypothetical protein
MIKKIISGGQTGADQAALDAAIQCHIPYGGWIPKGRLTEAGRLSNKYKLTEMHTDSYDKRTEQNVTDSDGTLIISHGEISGGSRYTQDMAERHGKPSLHIDLEKINAFQAAHVVKKWASDNNIEILNVAGSRISKDRYIYQDTMRLLTTVFHMEMIENNMPDPMNPSPIVPETIEGVIERLIDELPFRDKARIANMKEKDLLFIHNTLGSYIRNKYLWNGNEPLILDCMYKSGKNDIEENDVIGIIIRALWDELRKTHRLRVVR